MSNALNSIRRGTLYGLCIGDALSMPVHWYYNRKVLQDDYGWVTNYLYPRNPHPDSILWRSSYVVPNPARLVIDILLAVLKGVPLKAAILQKLRTQDNPLMGHPFLKLLKEPDEKVVGSHFSPACYVEDSVPAVIYLALKYHLDPEKALIVNTNLGGDNAGRGSILGALLGAAPHGNRKISGPLVKGAAGTIAGSFAGLTAALNPF